MLKEIIDPRRDDDADPIALLQRDKEAIYCCSHAWYNEIDRFIKYVQRFEKPYSQALLDEIDAFRAHLP